MWKKNKKQSGMFALAMVALDALMYLLPANHATPAAWIGWAFLLGIGIVMILNTIRIPKLEEIYARYTKRCNWILFFIITFLSFATLETLSGNFVFMVLPQHWIMNMVWFFLLSGLVYALFSKMKPALLTSLLFMSILGIANGFIVLFRGSPILPADLQLVETAMAVSGNYSFCMPFYMYIGMALLLETVFIILQIRELPVEKKEKKRFRMIYSIVVVLAIPVFFINASILRDSINLWRPVQTYRHYGSLNGFGINLYAMQVEEPEEYSPEEVETILGRYESDMVTGEESLPNVIVIMCETFSDLSVIGEYETNEEVIPYFKSITENVIKGKAYSSVLGGMTANSEYEFLTGNSTAFLPAGSVPYQQYIQGEIYSFTSTLKSLGYSSTALHAYEKNTYRREGVYPLMGFDEYMAEESFTDPTYLREFISDESDYKKVIELYEERDASKPFYMFNITMQNHSGYDQKTMEYNIRLKGSLEGKYEDAEEYLSSMSQSDAAIATLIDYFSKEEEPTYIIFFGDHQPTLYSGFVEEVMGDELENLSTEEVQKRYEVPFMIWSNQDIEEKEVDAISINYLSSYFLQEAGLPMTAYNKFLMELYEQYPVINTSGFMDQTGAFYDISEMKTREALIEYNKVVYQSVIEHADGMEEFYKLKGVLDVIRIPNENLE